MPWLQADPTGQEGSAAVGLGYAWLVTLRREKGPRLRPQNRNSGGLDRWADQR